MSASTRATSEATGSGRLGTGPRRPMSGPERLGAVIGHHLLVYRRTWKGSIIGRFLSPLFFLLAMGLGLGSLVDESSGGVDGVSYLQFVVPGIIAMQAMFLAFNESTYAVMAYIRWNQMYAAMLATPLRVVEVLGGHLAVVGLHLLVATTIFVGVSALFGALVSWWALAAIPVGVLTGLAFAAPLFAFSAHIETDSAFGILFRFLITPLMLFSGTFFPIDQLPGWMEPLAWVTPLWHGVALCRTATLGLTPDAASLGHVAVLTAYLLVGWVLARRTFSARLTS
ncbi:MAG: ABC transporter permease [Ornithinibacter sp.]